MLDCDRFLLLQVSRVGKQMVFPFETLDPTLIIEVGQCGGMLKLIGLLLVKNSYIIGTLNSFH